METLSPEVKGDLIRCILAWLNTEEQDPPSLTSVPPARSRSGSDPGTAVRLSGSRHHQSAIYIVSLTRNCAGLFTGQE